MRGIGKITGILDGAKEKTSGVTNRIIGGTSEILDGAKGVTSDVADKIIGGTTRITQECNFSERIESIRKRLDENTPEVVKDASRRVGDSFDVLTGVKLLEVVQEMLQAQEEYNDILATKLDEALTRIALLEAIIVKGGVNEN